MSEPGLVRQRRLSKPKRNSSRVGPGSESTSELLGDLRECGEHPVTYGQETHGELHLDALKEIERLDRIIAWYWRRGGPYPTALDQEPFQ